MNNNDYILKRLFEQQDIKYRDFQSKLTPTVLPENMIGVRNPQVRLLAREIEKSEYFEDFIIALPHKYYEENNLHAYLVERIKDYDRCINELDRFLPFVDNWATCDIMRPKVFEKNTERLALKIKEWVKSDHLYTVRFGIGMLMSFFLDKSFKPEYCEIAAEIKSDEYYINMMIAWYFATALSKQWNYVLPYITQYRLPKWVHNKTIQKAVESYRITDEQKVLLKTYKIK